MRNHTAGIDVLGAGLPVRVPEVKPIIDIQSNPMLEAMAVVTTFYALVMTYKELGFMGATLSGLGGLGIYALAKKQNEEKC